MGSDGSKRRSELRSESGKQARSKLRPQQRSISGIGFEFAAGVAGMCLFGYWIGGHYGNAKLGVVIGAALGLIGSMYNVIRVALRTSARAEAEEGTDDSTHP